MRILKRRAALAAAVVLAGCMGVFPARLHAEEKEKKLNIVTTVFPAYDWVLQIMGGNAGEAEITLLPGSGADMHSYQPSAADIIDIDQCDLFIYVGGESEKWVRDVLAGSQNDEQIVVSLLDVLGDQVKEEETVEGMQEAHDGETECDAPDEKDLDEHVWLSLRNAGVLCDGIAIALEKADPEHAADYEENKKAYLAQLEELDARYTEMTKAAPLNTILVADRFPFRYLADDYDLSYYAAFSGCSAETEASFETIIFLAEKIKELGLDCVLTIDGSDQKIAGTVIATAGEDDIKILTLDSMQSLVPDAIGQTSYLLVMQKNYDTLAEALGAKTE